MFDFGGQVIESAEPGADKNYDTVRRLRFAICAKPPRRGVQGSA